jgi:hypothetical protein
MAVQGRGEILSRYTITQQPKTGRLKHSRQSHGFATRRPKPGCSTAAERFQKRNKFPNSNWRQVIRTAFPEDVAEAAIHTLENDLLPHDFREDEDDVEEEDDATPEPTTTLLNLRFIALNEPDESPAEAHGDEQGAEEEEPTSDLNADTTASTVVMDQNETLPVQTPISSSSGSYDTQRIFGNGNALEEMFPPSDD